MTEQIHHPALPPLEDDRQLSLLIDLMGEINRGATANRVFSLIGDTLRRLFGIDRFAVWLVGSDGLPHLVASHGLSPEYIARVNVDPENAVGMRAMQARTPLYVLDAPSSPEFAPFQEAAAREGFRTVLFFPLYSGGDALGFLVMYHDAVRPYTAADRALAQAVATQAGTAMAHARVLEDVESRRADLEQQYAQRTAEAEATDRIALQIASSLDLEQTFQSIVDAGAKLTRAATASLYVLGDDDTYRAVAAHGIPLQTLQVVVLTRDTGLMRQMCLTGEPAQVLNFRENVDRTSELARAYAEDLDIRSTLGIPLLQDGECIGALYVAQTGREPFSEDAVRMLKRLAAFAQVAMRNAERFTFVQTERSRLQRYVDAIPEGVIVFGRDGRVVLTNSALERELGMQRSILGMRRDDLFRDDSAFAISPVRFRFDRQAAVNRVLSTGQPEQGLLEIGDPARKFEINYSALRRADGRVDGLVATMRDITSPLLLEAERARTHFLSQLLDLSVQLNSDLSVPVLIERVVEAAMDLVGATAGTLGLVDGEELVFQRYHLPNGWTDFDVRVKRGEGAPGHVWATGKPYITNRTGADEVVLQTMRERLGFRRLVFVPVFDRSGKIIGTLGVYDPEIERDFVQSDVESLQLLAHQAAIAIENARLNELKDEFLSIVSHELKTPVTSIKGFTQILQRRLSEEALGGARRYLDVINHQSDRLTGLINDLLDLSRIQTGRFVFDTETVDYAALVAEVLEETRLVSPANSIAFTGLDHVLVQGNANRLRQVLVNLIDNGVKHGPPNGDLHVTLDVSEGMVYTYVCDEGVGLPAGEEEHIFAQYYQVRRGSERHARGLGLGLFISRQIVEEHGGKIWLDKADHTSFCFTLPLVLSDEAKQGNPDIHAHDVEKPA